MPASPAPSCAGQDPLPSDGTVASAAPCHRWLCLPTFNSSHCPGERSPKPGTQTAASVEAAAGTTEHGEGKRGQRAEGTEGVEGARTSEGVWVASCLGEVLGPYVVRNRTISTGLSLHLCGQHTDPGWGMPNTTKLKAFLGNLLFP